MPADRRAFGVLAALLVAACALPVSLGTRDTRTREYLMPPANSGGESYSAWFADSDGRVLYFGLSPFWTLWWEREGDALADLDARGDWLVGRFDLQAERFLPPLVVRGSDSGASVWDVLVHSSGRVFFTTFYDHMGSVGRDGSNPRLFPALGTGLNELVEGPDGKIYASRYYGRLPFERTDHGGVAVLSPDGRLLDELQLDARPGERVAAKSLAVDPASGDIWLNTDTFAADGSTRHETLRLDASGRQRLRREQPELQFVRFDRRGRGWFAEDAAGQLALRVQRAGETVASASLGPRAPLDFVQDIHFDSDGSAWLAFWSGRVVVAQLSAGGDRLETRELRFEIPARCRAPQGQSLMYSAIPARGSVYATLFCGGTVLARGVGR